MSSWFEVFAFSLGGGSGFELGCSGCSVSFSTNGGTIVTGGNVGCFASFLVAAGSVFATGSANSLVSFLLGRDLMMRSGSLISWFRRAVSEVEDVLPFCNIQATRQPTAKMPVTAAAPIQALLFFLRF